MTHKPSNGLSDIARDFFFVHGLTSASNFQSQVCKLPKRKIVEDQKIILKLQSYNESYDFQIVRFNGTGALHEHLEFLNTIGKKYMKP